MSDEYILEDFVDRTEEIGLLWQMQRGDVDTRVLAVEGILGIGKSYLLAEFKAECQENGIEVVHLDFDERYEDPGYMYLVKKIWTELGPDGFEPLARIIQETKERSMQDRILDELRAQTSHEIVPTLGGIGSGHPDSSTSESPGTVAPRPAGVGGVNVYGGTNTFRDVAGRDINNFFQFFQREDPFVQERAQIWITSILQQCLVDVTTNRCVVFLFDHWQKLDIDTRRWIARSLVKWLADASLPRAYMMITGLEVPDLEPRKRVKKRKLTGLDPQSAFTYLVDKRGISREEALGIVRYSKGIPLMMVMAIEPGVS